MQKFDFSVSITWEKKTIERTIKLLVIWDTIPLMWRHCNATLWVTIYSAAKVVIWDAMSYFCTKQFTIYVIETFIYITYV